jgi:hypothetical protein
MTGGGGANGTDGTNKIWSINLGGTPTWTQLKDTCQASGVQPGTPDTVGWAYDSTRNKAVMMPGFYFVTQSFTACPSITESSDSMAFDFSTNLWSASSYNAPTGGYGGDIGSSFSTYDPISDQVIRFRGDVTIEKLSLVANTWSYKSISGYGDLNRNQSAVDVIGRSVYVWSRQTNTLAKYDISGDSISSVSGMPPSELVSALPGTSSDDHEIWTVFDSLNRIVIVFGCYDGVHPFSGALQGLGIYHVDLHTWEWKAAPVTTPIIRGTTAAYDPFHNYVWFAGGNQGSPTKHWLYRYR